LLCEVDYDTAFSRKRQVSKKFRSGDSVSDNNGFYIGKKWLNVFVDMWKEDLKKGFLFKFELYEDPDLPDWWLDKVLKKF